MSDMVHSWIGVRCGSREHGPCRTRQKNSPGVMSRLIRWRSLDGYAKEGPPEQTIHGRGSDIRDNLLLLIQPPFEDGHQYRADFNDIHQLPSLFTEFVQFATDHGCRFGAWNLDEFHPILPLRRHESFAATYSPWQLPLESSGT